MNKLIGAVLCGGLSTRMGMDKGLIRHGSVTRAEAVADKLKNEGIEVVYSINASQLNSYANIINTPSLIIDSNDLPGPLKGLMSVHTHRKDRNILLLACDMLDITPMVIRNLIDAYHSGGYDHYAYGDRFYFQTFCAIYSSDALSTISASSLPGLSLQRILQEGKTCRLEVGDPSGFSNYNSP